MEKYALNGASKIKPEQPLQPKRCSRIFMNLWVHCTYMTTRVNFRLPDDLVEKADVAAAATHKNRTEIVVAALEDYLDEMEDQETFKQTVVDLYLDDEIGFESLKQVIGRQDAESVRASKTLLAQGEEMADDLAQL